MKTFYIDVGTHNAQEYSAIFELSYSYLFTKYVRHRVRSYRKRREALSWRSFLELVKNIKLLRSVRSSFYCIFIEPNRRLCALPQYRKANAVFNIAISASQQTISFLPLYFSNADKLGQGSSLFKSKPNVNTDDFEYVLNIDARTFALELKKLASEMCSDSYQVVLRINNEGAEVEVIQEFHSIFQEKLVGVMGSLADVAKVKSFADLDNLMAFMKTQRIPFTPLHSDFLSWPAACRFLSSTIKN